MSDTLYLSLWYPNLRLQTLPDKLTAVLGTFAAHGGEHGVYAATVWPVSWSEAPVFQRVWGHAGAGPEWGTDPREAVEEAMELLHDDYAYEFQIGWSLWELEDGEAGPPGPTQGEPSTHPPSADSLRTTGQNRPQDEGSVGSLDDSLAGGRAPAGLDPRWARTPRLVRVTGLGPLFDEGTYEQDGHIRVDFGSDAPFLEEGADLDAVGARHVEENVRQLVDLTQAIEKESGATARILWSELGESLAQRLAARLGVRN